MNIIKRLWWSLGHGNPVVPSGWQATEEFPVRARPIRFVLRTTGISLNSASNGDGRCAEK